MGRSDQGRHFMPVTVDAALPFVMTSFSTEHQSHQSLPVMTQLLQRVSPDLMLGTKL